MTHQKTLRGRAILGGFLLFSLSAGSAWGQTLVDCDAVPIPESIQAALDGGVTDIQFTGTCNEFVNILKDDTALQGVSPVTSIITGGIGVNGVQRVLLRNLTVTSPAVGLFIVEGATATIEDSVVEDTLQGFQIARQSFARLNRNTIGGRRLGGGALCNICVRDNATVFITNSTVTADEDDPAAGGALSVLRDAHLVMRGGNIVTNTGTQPAVSISQNSTFRQDNPSGNGTGTISGGIRVSNSSYGDLREAVVTGDVIVDMHSVLRVGSLVFGGDPSQIVIAGNITISRDSAVAFGSPMVTVTGGNVVCNDDESSLSGRFTRVGRVRVRCSGF